MIQPSGPENAANILLLFLSKLALTVFSEMQLMLLVAHSLFDMISVSFQVQFWAEHF